MLQFDAHAVRVHHAAALIAYQARTGGEGFAKLSTQIAPLVPVVGFEYYWGDLQTSWKRMLTNRVVSMWPADKLVFLDMHLIFRIFTQHTPIEQRDILVVLGRYYAKEF